MWLVHEQTASAALEVGALKLAAELIRAVLSRFPGDSARAQRLKVRRRAVLGALGPRAKRGCRPQPGARRLARGALASALKPAQVEKKPRNLLIPRLSRQWPGVRGAHRAPHSGAQACPLPQTPSRDT